MAAYSIKDLERVSNLKAHTIRIWEKRYQLFSPDRSKTNIRSYSDADLRKLLNVSTLLEGGMKISHISRLSNDQLIQEVNRVVAINKELTNDYTMILNECIAAITSYDEAAFESIFNETLKKTGIEQTYQNLIVPLLVSSGLLWVTDRMIPAQEHFLSNLVIRKLHSAIDQLPTTRTSTRSWLLFLNEEEDHEIGLLYTYYLIKSRGFKVIYLGSKVPFEDLVQVVESCKPTHLCTFFIRKQPNQYYYDYLEALISLNNTAEILVAGNISPIMDFAEKKSIIAINNLVDLEKYLITCKA